MVAVLLSAAAETKAQGPQNRRVSFPFGGVYDEDAWLSMGVRYNYVVSSYKIGLKADWASMGTTNLPINNELYIGQFGSIEGAVDRGMSIGMPIELRKNDNLSFIVQPSFVFINGTGIAFSDLPEDSEPIIIRTRHVGLKGANFTSFEFPVGLRFRSDEKSTKRKFLRYRGYVTAGARYTHWTRLAREYGDYETIKGNGNTVPQPLVMKPGYVSWEAGLGMELCFPFFRVSPEVKFVQSLGDVLDHDRPFAQGNSFMAPIDKMFVRNVQFSLTFQ